MRLGDLDVLKVQLKKLPMMSNWGEAFMPLLIDEQPVIDPIHAAGGCYCRECKYKDECIRRIEFIGRNFVLEQNTYEYHPLSFCSYGQRKETDLDEAIEKYLKIKEGGQHGQAENLRGAWG